MVIEQHMDPPLIHLIKSKHDDMSVINHLLLCTSTLFFCMVNFETHGCFIHIKGDTKHPNEWKCQFHPHKKRLYLPI